MNSSLPATDDGHLRAKQLLYLWTSPQKVLLVHENGLLYFVFYTFTILQPISEFNDMIIQYFNRLYNVVKTLQWPRTYSFIS